MRGSTGDLPPLLASHALDETDNIGVYWSDDESCEPASGINSVHSPHSLPSAGEPGTWTKKSRSHTASREVSVALTNTSFSSRKLNATVHIEAPLDAVWDALTDYENLGTFIPSLVENRCLERRPRGCLLYQVGAQDVAMGIKFRAACTLEIEEHPHGIAQELCATNGNWDRYFPQPTTNDSSSSSSTSVDEQGIKDISFSLVEGDFQAFKGIWRMQSAAADSSATVLRYSLYVKPRPWLPVRLIQNRISNGVSNNLKAVRRHAEQVHQQQSLKQQHVPQQQHVSQSTSVSDSIIDSNNCLVANRCEVEDSFIR